MTTNRTVFLVWFYNSHYENELLGLFSTKEKAASFKKRHCRKLKDSLHNYKIVETGIDKNDVN